MKFGILMMVLVAGTASISPAYASEHGTVYAPTSSPRPMAKPSDFPPQRVLLVGHISSELAPTSSPSPLERPQR